jgi:protein-L-isoaspartate(D-aspartate) O-methyltransferase
MVPIWGGNGSATEDTAASRARMVDEQLSRRGIRDGRVLQAMAKVPRENFVSPELRGQSYADAPLPIGSGQTISQPYMVATMVEALEVASTDRVLEVGTGTGYEAAILGELAAEVWTIERHVELAERAQKILGELGYSNVHVVLGDGSVGLPDRAPFDKILVAAGAPEVPKALSAQITIGGRLVVPVGTRTEQQLYVVKKTNEGPVVSSRVLCSFVPLVGEQGWKL